MNKVFVSFFIILSFSNVQTSFFDLSSATKRISGFVFPKKDLPEDISSNLKKYIIALDVNNVKYLVQRYKVNQFYTIEEYTTSSGRIHRFDTPLRFALHYGSIESFSVILDQVDDPNFRMRGFSHILHDAVSLKNVDAVELLVAKKGLHIDGDKMELASRYSPLSDAVVIEGILRNDQQEFFQAIGLSAQGSTIKLKEISDNLLKIRKIIALLASHGGQLYTPRTNERLLEQSRNLGRKNCVKEASFSE